MKYLIAAIISILSIGEAYSQYNFELKQTGFKNSFGIIQLPSETSVYVLDDNSSTLLLSQDEGTTWDLLTLPCDSVFYRYFGMQFIDENVGYIWGEAGSPFSHGIRPYIIKTVDKGKNWSTVNADLPPNAVISSIRFFDDMHGICFLPCLTHNLNGHPETYHTSDGGTTWITENSVFPYLYGEITKIDFVDSLNGFATGRNNNLFFSKTEDGGHVWYTNVVNVMGGHGTGVKFFSPTYGMLLSNDSIYFTYDAGDIWTKSKYPFSSNIKSYAFNEDNSFGYFISDNNVYLTRDKCNTWELIYSSNSIYFSDVKINKSNLYVSGTDGYILKLKLSNSNPSAENSGKETDILVRPNPTNGIITISCNSVIEKEIELEIYNTLGELVRKTATALNVGENNIQVNLKDLKSGIYFLSSNIDDKNNRIKLIKRD